ncbi:oligoribonuclease [Microbacterium suaedae]|uniref:oligoribonuclease n=1 Tax=Microbacterium suaedae TaxID=2067813 RepID=UPI000DA262BA|nr:oligoribonuclease [Microbacterium suaedae]
MKRSAVSTSENDRLVWIDCEMTGLDPSIDELVEIAVIVTDFELNILDPGLQIVIKPSDAALENMGEFVTKMHAASGLDIEIPRGVSLAEAERRVLEYVARFVPQERKAPLAGNTIGTDRMFLAKYMPELDTYLHYRNVDVSSIKELARRWMPRVYFQAPEKDGGHRALADIRESIRELRYYRRAAFVAEPGPSSDEAKAIAENVVNEFAENL